MGGRGSASGGSKANTDQIGAHGLSSDAAVREVQIENRIRAAYNELPHAPGGYVGLADLREHRLLRGLPQGQVDAALRRGNLKAMQLSTIDNTRGLRERDRQAALDVGGNPRHMISYRPPGGGATRVARLLKLPRGGRHDR